LLVKAGAASQMRFKVSQRLISNVALAIAGAVVVVVSQSFTSTVTGWVTFGVSLGALALLAVAERYRMGAPSVFLTLASGCSLSGRRLPPWSTSADS
jgi:hypothetical protein